MIDQRTKGARPDIVTADQPQPVDPLRLGEMCRAGCSDVHACPRRPAWINLREWGRGTFASGAPRNDGQGRLPHPLALRKSGPVFAGNEIMPMMSLAELQ